MRIFIYLNFVMGHVNANKHIQVNLKKGVSRASTIFKLTLQNLKKSFITLGYEIKHYLRCLISHMITIEYSINNNTKIF